MDSLHGYRRGYPTIFEVGMDWKTLTPAARSAAMRGGVENWGQHGSSSAHVRYLQPVDPRSRRRCGCGCKTRAAYRGMANGVALMSGCLLSVRRWVKNG